MMIRCEACGHHWETTLCRNCGHFPGPDSDPEQTFDVPPMSFSRMVERTVLRSSLALFWLAVAAILGAMCFAAVS